MSYIAFTYRCVTDGLTEDRFVKREVMDDQKCNCGSSMVKLPPATRTTYRYADSKLKP